MTTAGLTDLPYARLDQRYEVGDRLRCDDAGTGVQIEPRHLVLRREHALQHRHEALQIEELVERQLHIARFEPVDGRWAEVDAPDRNLAGLLAGLLQHLGENAGDAAVLRADGL